MDIKSKLKAIAKSIKNANARAEKALEKERKYLGITNKQKAEWGEP